MHRNSLPGLRPQRLALLALPLLSLLLLAPWRAAVAAEAPLGIEINKLEPRGQSCRAYLLFENRSAAAFRSLKLDLVLFDKAGVIAQRMVVEGAPLPAHKTLVKTFDLAVPCEGLGRVLLNDVLACDADGLEPGGCLAAVEVSAKGSVPFIK